MINGNPALNRVSWTPSGLHVTVGDDTGKIWVYDVAEVRSLHKYIFCLFVIYDIIFDEYVPRFFE